VEAKVLIERWRREYNQVRPHSALGNRPPAPEAILPLPPRSAPLHPSAMAVGLTWRSGTTFGGRSGNLGWTGFHTVRGRLAQWTGDKYLKAFSN